MALDMAHGDKNVAKFVDALLGANIYPLGEIEPFLGAGIYAIYYTGQFSAYASLASQNRNNKFALPIYTGGAVSPGEHQSVFGIDLNPPPSLYARLMDHAESIEYASNLHLDDFYCRYLALDEKLVAICAGELLQKFLPLWNVAITGFDLPNPRKGGYFGLRSKWDTAHPGRWWAETALPRQESAQEILALRGR